MYCRGWKASAPSGTGGFSGSARGLGSGLGAFISSSGKSLIGPDQESSTLSKEGLWCALDGSRGYGSTKKTMCHKAAAITARSGTLLSIQSQGRGDHRAERHLAFNPAVLEESFNREIPGYR